MKGKTTTTTTTTTWMVAVAACVWGAWGYVLIPQTGPSSGSPVLWALSPGDAPFSATPLAYCTTTSSSSYLTPCPTTPLSSSNLCHLLTPGNTSVLQCGVVTGYATATAGTNKSLYLRTRNGTAIAASWVYLVKGAVPSSFSAGPIVVSPSAPARFTWTITSSAGNTLNAAKRYWCTWEGQGLYSHSDPPYVFHITPFVVESPTVGYCLTPRWNWSQPFWRWAQLECNFCGDDGLSTSTLTRTPPYVTFTEQSVSGFNPRRISQSGYVAGVVVGKNLNATFPDATSPTLNLPIKYTVKYDDSYSSYTCIPLNNSALSCPISTKAGVHKAVITATPDHPSNVDYLIYISTAAYTALYAQSVAVVPSYVGIDCPDQVFDAYGEFISDKYEYWAKFEGYTVYGWTRASYVDETHLRVNTLPTLAALRSYTSVTLQIYDGKNCRISTDCAPLSSSLSMTFSSLYDCHSSAPPLAGVSLALVLLTQLIMAFFC